MSKELIKKMESQIPEWEKVSANHISDGGLVSKLHKELS